VAALRRALAQQGLEVAPGDAYDAATAEAVRLFQLSWDLPPTGEADPATTARLAAVAGAGVSERVVVTGAEPDNGWRAALAVAIAAVLLLAGCAGAELAAPPTAPICSEAREGEDRGGCWCEWGDEWGWAWVRKADGARGAADWCPTTLTGGRPPADTLRRTRDAEAGRGRR
jgi:hypothetical protein